MREKLLWPRAKSKANLKPKSRMKVVWNTCETELGGAMPDNTMKTTFKKFIWKFLKVIPFQRNLC